ncbi:ribonuclease Y [Atopobacter sp. AH10]|uniref:ribonuclease Y n=1 Tax=Atopobacter sp. AH10 TaxID=2315861 RepID=UPI000EF29207|nr:ribonuclease Y [Atopobacter sp. AH10]RLK63233.1 ribonuclease Y [Atopobacter sp. AH10]
MNVNVMTVAFAIITMILGCLIGYWLRKTQHEKEILGAEKSAAGILNNAMRDAERLKKDALIEARDKLHKYKDEAESELRERRQDVAAQEKRLSQRESNIDRKESNLEKRESLLENKEQAFMTRTEALKLKEKEAEDLVNKQADELERISMLTRDEAKQLMMATLDQELEHEKAVHIKEYEQEARDEADRRAQSIILDAIQRSAADTVSERTVSVLTLPNDDMKGRIIGKEGRNIRTLEALTGIDIIIDETPEAVVLSGFDPVRREIARMALEKLISDGRIHPARIEEMVEKARKEMDAKIRDMGERAIFEVGIQSLHPDLIKLLGRMYYRTSYGQNVLNHSIEVAKLAGVLASELGEDPQLAKRAGLLHDIGKAVDRDLEGSHVEIGAELVRKYKEPDIVVNAVASHHGDVPAHSIIAVLVAVADTLSAARPGARNESLENYVHRLERLEEIANQEDGVKKSYAIQAGREIRVIVEPNKISDAKATIIARDIKNNIENELSYPGHVKITVIRETRAIEYAK